MVAFISSIAIFIIGLVLVGATGGLIGVITSAALMILSEPEINASFFSIAMIVQNCGNIVARFIVGPLVDSGKDATGRIPLTKPKAQRAMWVAVGCGVLGVLSLPTIWSGLNRRVASTKQERLEEKKETQKGGPKLKQKGSNESSQDKEWPDMFNDGQDEEEGVRKKTKKKTKGEQGNSI